MTAGPGSMRIDRSRNIRKSVPFGLNREKQNAARNETTMAMITALSERTTEFTTCRHNSFRAKRRAKFSSVGVNMSLGGVARMSLRVLNADSAIHSTGDTKTIETTQSRT